MFWDAKILQMIATDEPISRCTWSRDHAETHANERVVHGTLASISGEIRFVGTTVPSLFNHPTNVADAAPIYGLRVACIMCPTLNRFSLQGIPVHCRKGKFANRFFILRKYHIRIFLYTNERIIVPNLYYMRYIAYTYYIIGIEFYYVFIFIVLKNVFN